MGKKGSCGFRSKVPRPASPGNFLGMQILGPPTRPAEWESWVGGQHCVLTCPPGESAAHPRSPNPELKREAFPGELAQQSSPAHPLCPGPQPISLARSSLYGGHLVSSHSLPPLPSSHSGPKTPISVFVYSSSGAAPQCLFSLHLPLTYFSDWGGIFCVSGSALAWGHSGEGNRLCPHGREADIKTQSDLKSQILSPAVSPDHPSP